MQQVTAQLIHQYVVCYDKNDGKNASLYLCFPPQTRTAAIRSVIAKLQHATLWSQAAYATIGDEQKDDYAEQLAFVDAQGYLQPNSQPFIAACFNHEKFPFHTARWQQWNKVLADNYAAANESIPRQ